MRLREEQADLTPSAKICERPFLLQSVRMRNTPLVRSPLSVGWKTLLKFYYYCQEKLLFFGVVKKTTTSPGNICLATKNGCKKL